MLDLIRMSGPFGMWVCLLALVNLCLVGWCLAKIVGTGPHADPALDNPHTPTMLTNPGSSFSRSCVPKISVSVLFSLYHVFLSLYISLALDAQQQR